MPFIPCINSSYSSPLLGTPIDMFGGTSSKLLINDTSLSDTSEGKCSNTQVGYECELENPHKQ